MSLALLAFAGNNQISPWQYKWKVRASRRTSGPVASPTKNLKGQSGWTQQQRVSMTVGWHEAHRVGGLSPAGPLSHVNVWGTLWEPWGFTQGGDIIDLCFLKNTVTEVTDNRSPRAGVRGDSYSGSGKMAAGMGWGWWWRRDKCLPWVFSSGCDGRGTSGSVPWLSSALHLLALLFRLLRRAYFIFSKIGIPSVSTGLPTISPGGLKSLLQPPVSPPACSNLAPPLKILTTCLWSR